jgi:hypothetical protein
MKVDHVAEDHLIGAYGMFWDRESVNWTPGGGGGSWQLLGRMNERNPALRICDFRRARGFYVLFDDHGANYVGLARGEEGIGQRLRNHHTEDVKSWSRFCWFAFDDVADGELTGWSQVSRRDALRDLEADTFLRECEALLITVLGSGRVVRWGSDGSPVRLQNAMQFQAAKCWDQLKEPDFRSGLAWRVATEGYTDPWLRSLLEVASEGS